jgi:opacity protein-like surface antigen
MKKILALAFCLTTPVQANQLTLNGGFGFTLTNLDFASQGGGHDKIGTLGPSAGGSYLYDFGPRFSAGIDLNDTVLGKNETDRLSPLIHATLSSRSFVALAIAKFSILPGAPVIPYVMGGAGFHHSSFLFDAKPAPGLAWPDSGTTEKRNVVDGASNNYALAMGGGFDIPLSSGFSLGMESRFQFLGDVHFPTSAVGQAYGVRRVGGVEMLVTTLAHVGYRF